jgi:hypothetical protein
LSVPEISRVVIGVDSLNQLKEILCDASGPMAQIPDEFIVNDLDLINPARWSLLT